MTPVENPTKASLNSLDSLTFSKTRSDDKVHSIRPVNIIAHAIRRRKLVGKIQAIMMNKSFSFVVSPEIHIVFY